MDNEIKLPVWILVLVISLTPVNAVLYAPALPKLSSMLNITQSQAQSTIALFLVGYAVSQLAFGSIANFLGRRKTLIIGISIGVAGSLLSIISCLLKNYQLLLYSRFLIGFGAASGLIITYAMINDIYTGIKAKKITGYIVASFAVAPGVANFAGGFLATIGPIACFSFLFIYNLIIMMLTIRLPETANKLNERFSIIKILADYAKATFNMKIIIYGIIYGIFAGILYSIVTILPFVGIKELGMSPQLFGFIFCLTYIGYFIGSITAAWLAEKINTNNSIFVGIILALTGNSILFLGSTTGLITIPILFFSIFLIFLSMPFIFVNASVKAVSSHDDKATASSVLNFINVSLACFGSFSTGMITSSFVFNLSTLIYAFLAVAVFALVLSTTGRKFLRIMQFQRNF